MKRNKRKLWYCIGLYFLIVVLAGCTKSVERNEYELTKVYDEVTKVENENNNLHNSSIKENPSVNVKDKNTDKKDTSNSVLKDTEEIQNKEVIEENLVSETFNASVSFIDVGQGDASLYIINDTVILIDTGEYTARDKLINYLKDEKVNGIDLMILTHPHSDHIANADDVIHMFDVKKVILPEVVHTTVSYENLINAMVQNSVEVDIAKLGEVYEIGGAFVKIVGPANSYKDSELNNWSVSVIVSIGQTVFGSFGDAEMVAEYDMIDTGECLDVDVMKASHHGSSSSNSEGILKATTPQICVIQCGKDNEYGHPHDEILERYKTFGIEVYRNDLQGDIKFYSDGEKIWTDMKPIENELNKAGTINSLPNNSEVETHQEDSISYVLNTNSKKFHVPTCSSVKQIADKNRSEYSGTRSELIDKGYDACKRCDP